MPVFRPSPYGAFNFRITAERFDGDPEPIRGGFQEASGVGMEVTVAEYRNGTDKENHVTKLNGIYKTNDVTLKRGLVGAASFFAWIAAVRDGDIDAPTQVKIELMNEAHTGTVVTWLLTHARPIKYNGPALNAKGGTDVAIEELVLASEKLDVL